jgi:hypothetical protein
MTDAASPFVWERRFTTDAAATAEVLAYLEAAAARYWRRYDRMWSVAVSALWASWTAAVIFAAVVFTPSTARSAAWTGAVTLCVVAPIFALDAWFRGQIARLDADRRSVAGAWRDWIARVDSEGVRLSAVGGVTSLYPWNASPTIVEGRNVVMALGPSGEPSVWFPISAFAFGERETVLRFCSEAARAHGGRFLSQLGSSTS